uniref:Charged multivesicular body protein 7 n=1 Tax=Percolomonas cosmopolitus TaxID=63605 RepID=A0A7S1KNY4_9EUKA|mmetsp:Transcript_11554/g.43369  ORF Transcript_11554/g.43369 Transcript_11554/m.43369 type:complete len:632 (+) Transcript_11554:18-1913(+)
MSSSESIPSHQTPQLTQSQPNTFNPTLTPKHLLTSLKKDRSVNPSDWDAKIDFWSNRIINDVPKRVRLNGIEIRDACRVSDAADSSDNILHQKNGNTHPAATTTHYRDWQRILQELVKRTVFLPLPEFERLYDPLKQESFGKWLLNRVGWLGGGEDDSKVNNVGNLPESEALSQQYLNVALLRDICIQWINEVYEKASTESDLIVSPGEIDHYFMTQGIDISAPQFANAFTELNDVRHLINFMHHEGPATRVPLLHNRCALKFSTDSSHRGNEKISESHRGVAQLKDTLHTLHKQAHELENRIQESTYNVRKNIQHQKKSKAKWEMGRKRMLENALERRRASIRNLEEILSSIQTAETDMQVMEALKSGTTSLRVLTADMGDVEGGLEEMADALADYKDIQDVLDAQFMEVEHVDDDEILKDLEKLSMEEQEKEEDAARKKMRGDESGVTTTATTSPSSSSPIPLPDISEISFSLKLLDDEISRIEREIGALGTAAACPKYLRDFQKELNMTYKLSKLKLKKRKRHMDEMLSVLEGKQQEFEKKALDLEEGGNSQDAGRYAHYAELVQEEISEIIEKHPELKQKQEQESNKKPNQSETPHKSVFEEQERQEAAEGEGVSEDVMEEEAPVAQ